MLFHVARCDVLHRFFFFASPVLVQYSLILVGNIIHLRCFCFVAQELRVPCLVVDGIIAFALHKIDSDRKRNAELVEAKKLDLEHEQDKRLKNAQKAATRAEQKAMEKRAKEGAGKHPNHANPIQQPDKNKKSK